MMVNSKFKIYRILEKISQVLSQTRRYLAIYQFLNEQPLADQPEFAPLFFGTVREATLREAILGITSLTDENQESINFKLLLDMAENHPRLLKHGQIDVKALVESERLRLAGLYPVLKVLRPVRDCELAQLDRKHLNDPATVSPYPIQPQDLSHCVEVLYIILCDIWKALLGVPIPEDRETGQIFKELESLWNIVEKDTKKAGQGE
jgi:hypothetical protein